MRKIKHHSASPEYTLLANFLYLNERRIRQRQQCCMILSSLNSNDCTCICERAKYMNAFYNIRSKKSAM